MRRSIYVGLVLSTLLMTSINTKADEAPVGCVGVFNVIGALLETNDTVYACVGMPLTFDDASLLDGLLASRDWVFGDGNQELDALLSAQTTHSYAEEGTYTATLTVASLLCAEITIPKTVIVLGNPEYNVLVGDIDCFGNCNGELTINIQSVNAALYNVVWDVTGTLGNTISGLCAGDYGATIGDDQGCTNLQSGPVNLPEPDLLIANIGLSDTLNLCPDNGVTDIPLNLSGGTGTLLTDWGSSTAITGVNANLIQFTPSENSLDQMYHVLVQDENGCVTEDSIFIGAILSVLQGQVTVGSNPCKECEVVKYFPAAGLWQIADTDTTDLSGNYDFGAISNLLPFTIMVNPNEVNHPLTPLGFYPEGHKWNTASVLTNVCGINLTKNIALLDPQSLNGTNTLLGTVWHSTTGKMQAEDPIPLIDVVVEKTPPGQGRAQTTTNGNGEYEFNFVPNSDTIYTLFVSMPGIPVNNTYEILANTGNKTYCELDFCLNEASTEINICNGNENPCEIGVVTGDSNAEAQKSLTLYPNPTNGMFTIETGKFAETTSEIRIVDPTGRVVFQKRYEVTPYTINMVNLAEGYYLVQIMNERDSDASPISVMRY